MPRRTNLFQNVVAIIQRHMADDAVVEESAMLVDRVTDEEREVDVVIRATPAGHPVAVGVEASSTRRPASVTWVDEMVGKHAHLPTDKLVLVSESGFTAAARKKAEVAGVIALAPEDLPEGDPAFTIVNRLRSLWPKVLSLTPEKIGMRVLRRGDDPPYVAPELADFPVFLDDGYALGTLEGVVRSTITANIEKIFEQIGLRDIEDDLDRFFSLEIGPSWRVEVDGEKRSICVRVATDPPELRPIDALQVLGRAEIRVSEIPLKHGRLGDVRYAYGEGSVLGADDSLVVVTEDEGGGKLTIRTPASGPPTTTT
jgi:hypothetical protein